MNLPYHCIYCDANRDENPADCSNPTDHLFVSKGGECRECGRNEEQAGSPIRHGWCSPCYVATKL